MKTEQPKGCESKIAEENIKKIDFEVPREVSLGWDECLSHKTSCQRFLEFLEESIKDFQRSLITQYVNVAVVKVFSDEIKKVMNTKITDLKQVIKLYEDAGI